MESKLFSQYYPVRTSTTKRLGTSIDNRMIFKSCEVFKNFLGELRYAYNVSITFSFHMSEETQANNFDQGAANSNL